MPPYEINNSKYQKWRNLIFVKKRKDMIHRMACGDGLKLKETGARIPQNKANRQVIFSFIFALPYLTKSKKLVAAINGVPPYDGMAKNFIAF
ncbi:hypothetical protein [Escherichia phage T5_ev212]|nr:hypothetical protein [Escherichia phage T5_ev212]